MKSFAKLIKLLALAFAGMFILNMLIMLVFFDTNAFNPVNRDDPEISVAENHIDSGNTSDFEMYTDDVYPENASAALDASDEHYQEDDDAVTALEESSSNAADEVSGADSAYFMTSGEIGFLENLGLKDKLEALSLISKIGMKEADKIYYMALDGITYSEMEDIEAILTKYLNQKEMEILTGLFEKNKKQYSSRTLP